MTDDYWLSKLKNIDRRFFVFVPILAVPAFLFRSVILTVLLISLTLAVSYFGQKLKFKKFGIELATFTTVLTGMSFGALPGAIIGMALITAHNMITRRIDSYLIIVIPVFGIIGAIASVYSNVNVLMLGIGLTIFSHFMFLIFQKLISGSPGKYVPYLVMNLLLNSFLFYKFAPAVLSAL